jgi:His/Glu/Gln/Arg/opine family amino acid ABC transporter permease subunit
VLDLNFIARNLPLFIEGVTITVALAAAGGVGALCGGGLVVAGTTSRVRPVRAVAQAYVEAMRNTPVLIQMFLIYFGLATFGIRLPAFASALLALVMQNSAYVGEIYRAGFRSVSRRQYEAALALGLLPRTAILTMIMPQALRRVIPPLASQLVIILKDSSIASTITVAEVTQVGKLVLERTAAPYEVFATLAMIYLALSTIILGTSRLLERVFPVRV